MSVLLFALAVAAAEPASATPEAKPKDKIVCTRSRTNTLGSNISQPRVCKRKSEWDEEARTTKRELRDLNNRGIDPFIPPAGQPIPQ